MGHLLSALGVWEGAAALSSDQAETVFILARTLENFCHVRERCRCIGHSRNVRFLGSLGVKVRIRAPEVVHTKSNLTSGLCCVDEICSWSPGSDYPSPCTSLPSFLSPTAWTCQLSACCFPLPSPESSHTLGLWQTKLKPQGRLVFNRLLSKMLTGSLSHPAWHCGISHCLTKIRSWNCSLWMLLWACPSGGTACLLHGSPSEMTQLGFLLILEAIVIFSAPLGHPFTCFVNSQSSFCL